MFKTQKQDTHYVKINKQRNSHFSCSRQQSRRTRVSLSNAGPLKTTQEGRRNYTQGLKKKESKERGHTLFCWGASCCCGSLPHSEIINKNADSFRRVWKNKTLFRTRARSAERRTLRKREEKQISPSTIYF